MNHPYLEDKVTSITKSNLWNLNIFWIGYAMYSFSYALIESGHVNFKAFQSIQLLGVAIIFACGTRILKFDIENSYLKTVYTFYIFWLFFLVLSGYSHFTNYDFVKNFLVNQSYGGMLYFAPLFLLYPKNLFFYKKAFDVILVFCLFYIFYDLLFIRDLLNSDRSSLRSQGIVEVSTDLSFPCGFILLTYAYHSDKKKIIALVTVFLTLLFSIIRARRGLIMMTTIMSIFSYCLYLFTSKRKSLIIYISVIAISLGAIYATAMYKPSEGIFGFLMERGTTDTRTGVEESFYADMKDKDWLIGRGIAGEYFSPGIEEDLPTNYRTVIETGYLMIILKGGLVSLCLYLLITIPAIYLGLFYSKNLLSKAAALWILFALISLYPTQVNTFTLRYFLVWISIGICYSKKIRNIPEIIMKDYFMSNK